MAGAQGCSSLAFALPCLGLSAPSCKCEAPTRPTNETLRFWESNRIDAARLAWENLTVTVSAPSHCFLAPWPGGAGTFSWARALQVLRGFKRRWCCSEKPLLTPAGRVVPGLVGNHCPPQASRGTVTETFIVRSGFKVVALGPGPPPPWLSEVSLPHGHCLCVLTLCSSRNVGLCVESFTDLPVDTTAPTHLMSSSGAASSSSAPSSCPAY